MASDNCTTDKSICSGDTTYAFIDGVLLKGGVDVVGDKLNFVDEKGKAHVLSRDALASSKPGQCIESKICIGASTKHDTKTKTFEGKIIAVFPNKFAVIDEGPDGIRSVRVDEFTVVKDPKEVEKEKQQDQIALTEALKKINAACTEVQTLTPTAEACFKPQNNLNRDGTFASTLLNPASDAPLLTDLGASCGPFVQKIYKDGGTLASSTVIDAARPISSIALPSGQHDGVFYHYTTAVELMNSLHPEIKSRKEAQLEAVKNKEYDHIFEFYKTRAPDPKGFWDRIYYIAEDPVSSEYAGTLRIRFTLDPKAHTVTWDDRMWVKAIDELDRRYPGFKSACGDDLPLTHKDTYGTVRYNNILFVMAEDSGIDLLDYNSKRWFMLVSPKSIRETNLEKCATVDVPRGFEPEKHPGQFVPVCEPYAK
jgi:hypothetical protein